MRFLSIFSLLLSAASLASASTLSTTCTQNVYLSQSGSGQTVVCGGFTAPVGYAITDIKWGYGVDFQYNPLDPGAYTILAAFDGPGANDATGLLVTSANRPLTNLVNVALADFGLFSSGASFATSYVGASTAITGATFNAMVNFTYEVQDNVVQSGVPEPSTLALVGGVLVLAGIRKFKS